MPKRDRCGDLLPMCLADRLFGFAAPAMSGQSTIEAVAICSASRWKRAACNVNRIGVPRNPISTLAQGLHSVTAV